MEAIIKCVKKYFLLFFKGYLTDFIWIWHLDLIEHFISFK